MRFKHTLVLLVSACVIMASGLALPLLAQRVFPVRVDRWLEIRNISGQVTSVINQVSQIAQPGQRLASISDGLVTSRNSTATLAVDTGVGFINVAENTSLRVQELRMNSDGSHITRLLVARGQVRLQVRPFTHRSTLQIETPAGVSGVRGTQFGLSIHPDGKTGVATLEGAVYTEAQNQAVTVNARFQSLVVPGEAPSPPQPLRDEPGLDIRYLAISDRQVRIEGRIDPVNLLKINGIEQSVSRTGDFAISLPSSSEREVEATVTTPLGKRQVYRLRIP